MKTLHSIFGQNVCWTKIGSGRLLRACLAGLGLCLLSCSQAFASDPIGIYGIVDKVIVEPKEGSPERIQIWGTFSLAQGRGETYSTPEHGYLYYKLPKEKAEAASREWKDIQSVAGKHQAVGFGARYDEKGAVRKASEKPDAPDLYPLGFGLKKIEKAPKDYPALQRLFQAAEKAQGKGAARS